MVVAVLMAQVLCFGQGGAVVTFAGRDANNHYVRPDSVVVENLTRQWTETLYWPDTVLTLTVGTGIDNPTMTNGIRVSPNPFDGTAQVEVPVEKAGEVQVQVADMLGRVCAQYDGKLPAGTHLFRIALGCPQVYVLTVWTARQRQSAKLENAGRGGRDGIAYAGMTDNRPVLKLTPAQPFYLGDEMRYSGYAGVQRSQTVTRSQGADETVQLVFIQDGSPCPGAATVTDIDGNVYNTVHIGDQCWMRENLRVTRYEDGNIIPNYGYSYDFPCRYAPNNDDSQVPVYGYLYNWPAAMGGAVSSDAVPSGVQGACPNGWHLPSEEEWATLWYYMNGQTRYACYTNGDNYFSKALSSTSGWDVTTYPCSPGNDQSLNNASGFNAYPAGYCYEGTPICFGYNTLFWCATQSVCFGLVCGSNRTYWTHHDNNSSGFSVRCVRD